MFKYIYHQFIFYIDKCLVFICNIISLIFTSSINENMKGKNLLNSSRNEKSSRLRSGSQTPHPLGFQSTPPVSSKQSEILYKNLFNLDTIYSDTYANLLNSTKYFNKLKTKCRIYEPIITTSFLDYMLEFYDKDDFKQFFTEVRKYECEKQVHDDICSLINDDISKITQAKIKKNKDTNITLDIQLLFDMIKIIHLINTYLGDKSIISYNKSLEEFDNLFLLELEELNNVLISEGSSVLKHVNSDKKLN